MKITARYITYKTIEVNDKFKVLSDNDFWESNPEEVDKLIEELPTAMAIALGVSKFDVLGGLDAKTNELLFEN